MNVDRDAVLGALRVEDVAAHLGITGAWRGRWLRSSRCAVADHSSDAFGLARDGFWHCWACDSGGDLLKLVAVGEGLDIRADFPKVLAIAAAIAGVDGEEDFGGGIVKPAPRPRPALPPPTPIAVRIEVARKRAPWIWGRLVRREEMKFSASDGYLRTRSVDPAAVRAREELRETPLRCTIEEACKHPDLKSLSYTFASPGLAIPVRAVTDGCLVDVRVRRFEPRTQSDGTLQPKIVGMLGGVTAAAAEPGKPRTLVGCYGHPERVDADTVVIVEGALDYLTGLVTWPDAQVLGAVEAGSLALVTAHAARQLVERDDTSRLLIVEQRDPPRTLRDGRVVPGAADASVNEDPNAATKVAVRILGPRRVGWLFCEDDTDGVKDLNDLARRYPPDKRPSGGRDITARVRWWTEPGA